MGLREDIKQYMEPCGAVSIYKNPVDDSCDNLLEFTSIYKILCDLNHEPVDLDWFCTYFKSREIETGSFKRKSFETWPSSFDDHTAIAAASRYYAERIAEHGHWNDWTWNGNFLGRIPGFVPAVKAACNIPLNPLSQAAAASDYVGNFYENKNETSGRILLWLRSICYGNKYPGINIVIAMWKERMRAMYPGGVSDLFKIYIAHDQNHPFIKYAPHIW